MHAAARRRPQRGARVSQRGELGLSGIRNRARDGEARVTAVEVRRGGVKPGTYSSQAGVAESVTLLSDLSEQRAHENDGAVWPINPHALDLANGTEDIGMPEPSYSAQGWLHLLLHPVQLAVQQRLL